MLALMPSSKESARVRPPIPDLLCAEPSVRIGVAAVRAPLVFSFAIGGAVETFEQHLAAARLPPSAWDRGHFRRDLFLGDLVERCLPVRAGGRVYRPSAAYLLRAVA